VWLTGEMVHHDCIAAASDGTHVVVTNHSNTERGFLPFLRDRLAAALASAFASDGVAASDVSVVVTALDADPLVVL
jgi:putative NIF3 family GTP cyclohydrolase 1 type 2